MTYLPICDFGSHPYFKKKHLVYVMVGRGAEGYRWRLRFCPDHLAVLQEDLAQFEVRTHVRTIRALDVTSVECVAGDGPVREGGWQFFLTCYPAQDERVDYWTGIHGQCSLPVYLKDPYQQSPHP